MKLTTLYAMRTLFASILMGCWGYGLNAQALDAIIAGTHLVVGFPDTTSSVCESRFPTPMKSRVQLRTFSAVDYEGNITSPAGCINRVRPRTEGSEIVGLTSRDNTAARPIVTDIARINNATFDISATYPAIGNRYYATESGGEFVAEIPAATLGKDYIVPAQPGETPRNVSLGSPTESFGVRKMGPSDLLMAASYDNTNVTIHQLQTTQWWDLPALAARRQKGQCYLPQRYVDTCERFSARQPDLTGTRRRMDRLIGVVCGVARTSMGYDRETSDLAGNGIRNLAVEQRAPSEQHGNTFVHTPSWDSHRITGILGSVLQIADTLIITDTSVCESTTYTVKDVSTNPAGLLSISLDTSTINNAKLVFVNPTKPADLVGATFAIVRCQPVDPLMNASAQLVIMDRTGAEWRLPFGYIPPVLSPNVTGILDAGRVRKDSCVDTLVTFTNNSSRPINVTSAMLMRGDQGFTIKSIEPGPTPVVLDSGESVIVHIGFCSRPPAERYFDTLKVVTDCDVASLVVTGVATQPCVYVDDLNFGVFRLGVDGPRTLPLDICNAGIPGGDTVTFNNPNGGSVIEWLVTNFTVPQSTIDSLRDVVRLAPQECFTLFVTFTPTSQGVFRSTAKFWSNAECRRDTSVWSAIVVPAAGVPSHDDMEFSLGSVRPTPTATLGHVTCTLTHPEHIVIEILDEAGRLVNLILDENLDAGEHNLALDIQDLPSGVYRLRMHAGSHVRTTSVVVVH